MCYPCLGTCVTHVSGPKSEEGWLRHQENFGEAHLSAADGVVAHKSKFRCERRLFLMAAPCRACAGSAPRPLQQGGFATFSLCRVHPSSRGGDYGRPFGCGFATLCLCVFVVTTLVTHTSD